MIEINSWNELDENQGCFVSNGLNIVEVENNENFVNVFLEDEATLVKQKLIWKKESLNDCILFLQKMGFDVEYKEPFNLSEFLEASLKPKKFELDKENYSFIYLHQYKIFKYNISTGFESIGDVCFEKICPSVIDKINKENITVEQLKAAFKELGWL